MTTKAQEKQKMSEIDENISKIFDIKKRLGKGAYGIVWKALDKRSNETIAVKKIFDAFRDETDAQRTFREIIFLKAFRSHPNIVKLHNVYKASNNLDIYLIFEFMESDLHNIIKKGTILKDIHKRYVMYQLINAIKYIHSGNVIHRDLKPSNVLIDSKCRCKLADFGLARSVAMREENNDLRSDKAVQPLLTDYVATRWYRAPEILVASKRYTKGIDMWSLGCILGEMIRGKPIFQGSSTVDQIEKIVYTLPDITEQDIKSVGAGFGSVLLNKQISKEKKITLNELLSGAPGDALDLVKSLLVLDPIGRLTAKQAINHPYVEKFRNSIPELELSANILPPFRDDVRLTVPEYRSKLYEIVQVHGEKNRTLEGNTKSTTTIKSREHKPPPSTHETADSKKQHKVKHQYMDDKNHLKDKSKTDKIEIETQQQISSSLNTIINRALKKTTAFSNAPLVAKRKNRKTSKTSIGDVIKTEQNYIESNVKEERHLHRSKSHGHHQHQQYKVADHLSESATQMCESNLRRNSINDGIIGHTTDDHIKRLSNSQRLHRSAVALNKSENEINAKADQLCYAPTSTIKNSVRHTKSEVIPLSNTPSNDSSKAQDRICYERRLKKLEEEIERYKSEVKSFCRDTFKNSTQHCRNGMMSEEVQSNKVENNGNANAKCCNNIKQTPKKSTSSSTPIKNTYFQLLTKGQHHDHNKSDLDLSGNSGNGSSSDHFRNSYNSNSCSGRRKQSTKYQYHNNILNPQQQYHLEQQLQDQPDYRVTQKNPPQHRCRPISKFI